MHMAGNLAEGDICHGEWPEGVKTVPQLIYRAVVTHIFLAEQFAVSPVRITVIPY